MRDHDGCAVNTVAMACPSREAREHGALARVMDDLSYVCEAHILRWESKGRGDKRTFLPTTLPGCGHRIYLCPGCGLRNGSLAGRRIVCPCGCVRELCAVDGCQKAAMIGDELCASCAMEV